MSAWDVAARSGRGPPPVPSMIRRVRRDVTPRVAARAWAASYHRGAPRVSRGAPNVGVEERPGFAGAFPNVGVEECPGFAGAFPNVGVEERPGFAGALRTLWSCPGFVDTPSL